MERCKRIFLLAVFFQLVVSIQGVAQNFQTVLGVSVGSGARALGMGGAFIAVADDATAASWNPAGLCVLDDPEVSFVWKVKNSTGTTISPISHTLGNVGSANYVSERLSATSFSSTGQGFDFASATYRVEIGKFKLVPQISMQRAIDFDFTQKQNQPLSKNDIGSSDGEINTFTQSETNHFESDGSLDIWAASLGVSFHPEVYLGVALNWWTGRARFESRRAEDSLFCTPDECISNTLLNTFQNSRNFDGFNINLGILWKPVSWLNVGAVLKTPFHMQHRLNFREYEIIQFPDAAFQRNEIYSESGNIEWPHTMGAGLAWMPRQEITTALDFSYTNWSAAKYNYDFRDTKIEDNSQYSDSSGSREVIWPAYFDPSQAENIFNQRQPDTWQLRAGFEYVILAPVIVPLRAGIYSNRQFVRDGAGNHVTHLGLTLGAGLIRKGISIDMALVHEHTSATGCGYAIIAENGDVETCRSDTEDTFQSDRIYLSGIYRF